MDKLEQYAYKRIRSDFPAELEVLEKCLNTILKYSEKLIKIEPLLSRPALRDNLKETNMKTKRHISHILLIYLATMYLQSARLLMVYGYLGSSLACLRNVVESILSSHVCRQNGEKAIDWLDGKKLERKGCSYPRELPKKIAEKIKSELSDQGAHPGYYAFLTQVGFRSALLNPRNRKECRYYYTRHIYFLLFISNRFLGYMLNKNPSLRKEIPNPLKVLEQSKNKADEISRVLRVLLKDTKDLNN